MRRKILSVSAIFNSDVVVSNQLLCALLLLVFFVGSASAQDHSCMGRTLDYHWGSFTSGGKLIHVEIFRPKGPGKFPAIILVHGSGGLLSRNGTQMPLEDNFGEIRIACSGYIAVLVHYFDRSGILSTTDKAYMKQNSNDWIETLQQAVDYASELPSADSSRIGLFGESLGGYLALSLALRDRRIRAVSVYGGGIQLGEHDDPAKLPPVLILHGRADMIVPVSEALRLDGVLTEHGVDHRIEIFEGINHYPSNRARTEIEKSAVLFFDQKLAGESSNREPCRPGVH